MRRTILTIFAFALFMLIPVDALARTTQGPTKIKGTATNGLSLEVTGPAQFDSNVAAGAALLGGVPNTWYVNSVSGSDSNTGVSESTALATIGHLLSQNIRAGDAIMLARGSVWHEQLNAG